MLLLQSSVAMHWLHSIGRANSIRILQRGIEKITEWNVFAATQSGPWRTVLLSLAFGEVNSHLTIWLMMKIPLTLKDFSCFKQFLYIFSLKFVSRKFSISINHIGTPLTVRKIRNKMHVAVSNILRVGA